MGGGLCGSFLCPLLQKCIPFLCEFLQLHCIVKKKEGANLSSGSLVITVLITPIMLQDE